MDCSFAFYQLTIGLPGIMSKSLTRGLKAVSASLNRGLSLEVRLRILAQLHLVSNTDNIQDSTLHWRHSCAERLTRSHCRGSFSIVVASSMSILANAGSWSFEWGWGAFYICLWRPRGLVVGSFSLVKSVLDILRANACFESLLRGKDGAPDIKVDSGKHKDLGARASWKNLRGAWTRFREEYGVR